MKKVFYISITVLLGIIVFDYLSLNQVVCDSSSCFAGVNGFLQGIFINTVFITFLCVVLKFLPRSCFTYWWKFAKFAIPLVFVLILLINLGFHHNPGGWFNTDNEVDLVRLALIYAAFFIGSVIQIIRGYRQKVA